MHKTVIAHHAMMVTLVMVQHVLWLQPKQLMLIAKPLIAQTKRIVLNATMDSMWILLLICVLHSILLAKSQTISLVLANLATMVIFYRAENATLMLHWQDQMLTHIALNLTEQSVQNAIKDILCLQIMFALKLMFYVKLTQQIMVTVHLATRDTFCQIINAFHHKTFIFLSAK